MWSWRRASPFGKVGLPAKCFISHSYKDADGCERLLALLPRSVEPFVFPPIVVPPEQMVSDKLLDAIRDCDGLIYMQGGASAESFWVALERNYALRIGKPAFGYDPTARALNRDMSPPMNLTTHLAFTRADQEVAEKLAAELQRHYFNVWIDMQIAPDGSLHREIVEGAIARATQAGSYVIVLVSRHSAASSWIRTQTEIASQLAPGRMLYALIEDCAAAHEARNAEQWAQLYGDQERSWTHRIDDLIVRLYWVIYGNTHQNQLS